MIEWMAWTLPTALFFIVIGLILVGMFIWQLVSPTVERRGLLPIETTRGDRFFIGLLSAAYIHLAWIGLTDFSLWFALAISVLFCLLLMRYG
jgi:predicted small integral membrane protein